MTYLNYIYHPQINERHRQMVSPDYANAEDRGLVDRAYEHVRGDPDHVFGLHSTEVLKGIGPKTADRLEKAGIATVSQLAHANDRSISRLELPSPQQATVQTLHEALRAGIALKEARADTIQAELDAVGDLPSAVPADYAAEAKRYLLENRHFYNDVKLGAAEFDAAVQRAINTMTLRRRFFDEGPHSPTDAWTAEFDIGAFSYERRLRVVHGGDGLFHVWSTN